MSAQLRANLLPPDMAARDAAADALLRFENHERAMRQSAATVAGQRAELEPRAPLSLKAVGDTFDRMFGARS